MIHPYVASTWCARAATAWQFGVLVWLLWPYPKVAVWYAFVLAPSLAVAGALLLVLRRLNGIAVPSQRAIFLAYVATATLAPSFSRPSSEDPTTAAIFTVAAGAIWFIGEESMRKHWLMLVLMLVPALITVMIQGNWAATIGAVLVFIAQLWHAADAYLRIGSDETS